MSKKDHFYWANHVEEFCKTTLPKTQKNVKNEEKMRLKICKKHKTKHEDVANNEEIRDVVQTMPKMKMENEDGARLSCENEEEKISRELWWWCFTTFGH